MANVKSKKKVMVKVRDLKPIKDAKGGGGVKLGGGDDRTVKAGGSGY